MANVLVPLGRKKPVLFNKWIWLSLVVQLVIAVIAVWFVYEVRAGRFSAETEVPRWIEFLLSNAINLESGFVVGLVFVLILFPIAFLFKIKKINRTAKATTELVLSFLFSFLVGSKFWAYGTFLVIFYIAPHWVPFIHRPEVSWLLALGCGATAIILNFAYSWLCSKATQ